MFTFISLPQVFPLMIGVFYVHADFIKEQVRVAVTSITLLDKIVAFVEAALLK